MLQSHSFLNHCSTICHVNLYVCGAENKVIMTLPELLAVKNEPVGGSNAINTMKS